MIKNQVSLRVTCVSAFCFNLLVDLGTGDTGEHLLGELVLGLFSVPLLALLVLAHSNKAGTESDSLVGELGLVLLRVAVVCSAQNIRSERRALKPCDAECYLQTKSAACSWLSNPNIEREIV